MEILNKRLTGGEYSLSYCLIKTGAQYSVHVGGGEEHIGSVALAVPRPGPDNAGKRSVTVSVLNVTGHKDEAVSRPLAESLCRAAGRPAVAVAGVHYHNLSPEGIRAILQLNEQACREIPAWIRQFEAKES